jgi:hypothetical protein
VNRAEIYKASKAGVLYVRPSVTLESAEDDTFQNASIGAQGFYMLPDQDPAASGWIFLYSVGLEGSRNLESYAGLGLVELGITTPFRPIKWLPFDVVLGREMKFGIFGQVGYKFKDENPVNTVDTGLENSSKEEDGRPLARVKGNAAIDMQIIDVQGIAKAKITASATLWYDVVNDEFYDREEAALRLTPLFWESVLKDKHIVLSYERGSGSPTFNKGEQFGIALCMEF